jgi:ribonuclease Z
MNGAICLGWGGRSIFYFISMLKFSVTPLGTNAAVPAYGRFLTSQVVNVQDHLYLIDCGEGTQMRMVQYRVKWRKIENVFISHMHGDHVYGIVGWLSSMNLNRRTSGLCFHGPPELEEFIRHQLKLTGHLNFPLQFRVVDPTKYECIFEDNQVSVYSLPLIHRIPASGFLFKEKSRPRSMVGEAIEQYNIPYAAIPSIKQGADFTLPDGTIIPNVELTTPPPAVRSYAFCSDTAYNEPLLPYIQHVNLLYHESTFMEEHLVQAAETGHSTARQAATIARNAAAEHLLLGHFSSRYRDLSGLLEEAKAVFPSTSLAKDGEEYLIRPDDTE